MKIVNFKLPAYSHKEVSLQALDLDVDNPTLMYNLLRKVLNDSVSLKKVSFIRYSQGKNMTLKLDKADHKKLKRVSIEESSRISDAAASIITYALEVQ